MEFLNPTALFGLFALPLLVIPYLVRKRPRRLVFSSLLLFTQGGMQSGGRPLGRLHLPPIFFLQLLLLALLIFALSEPVFSVRPSSMAIVLDNSASMQAMEEGKTRLTLAKEKAGALADEVGAGGKIELYTTTPRLERITAAALTPAEAKGLISHIAANDLGDPPIDYDNVLRRLAQERKYQRVYLITDHPSGSQSALAQVISVGAAKSNLAITDFEVHRSSLVNARLEASVTVHNFSGREEKVKVALKGNGAALATRELAVGADKTATAAFESIPEQPAYEAEIDARDALPLDNRRFAVAPTSRNLRILAVTPRPQALASLRSIPGVSVDVISPAEYEKFTRTGYGLEIFHFAAPGALPENPALFILPPESSSLVDLGPPTANVQVSSWREPHTLTRYINFSLFRPTYARPLKPQTPGDVIIETPNGALAFSTERQGVRYLALGFDPLPYLGRENLPMSIFTLNFLDWFFESGTTRAQATGEPIALGSIQPSDIFINPAGEKVSVKPGVDVIANTFQQGIYQRQRSGGRELYARNLTDLIESDLRAPPPIELHDPAKSPGTSSALFTFWPYLLLASLLLFFIEWFITPRMISGGLRQGSRPAVLRR
jgi:aerotolerance regulator-like protein